MKIDLQAGLKKNDRLSRRVVSSEGKYIALGSLAGHLKIIERRAFGHDDAIRIVVNENLRTSSIQALALSEKKGFAVSGTQDGIVMLFDLKTGDRVILESARALGSIRSVAFAKQVVMAAGDFGQVTIWNLHSKKKIAQITLSEQAIPITAIATSVNAKTWIAFRADGAFYIGDFEGKILKKQGALKSSARRLKQKNWTPRQAVSPSGQVLAVESVTGQYIQMLSMETGRPFLKRNGAFYRYGVPSGKKVEALRFSEDAQKFYVLLEDHSLMIFDQTIHKLESVLFLGPQGQFRDAAHQSYFAAPTLSQDGRFVLTENDLTPDAEGVLIELSGPAMKRYFGL